MSLYIRFTIRNIKYKKNIMRIWKQMYVVCVLCTFTSASYKTLSKWPTRLSEFHFSVFRTFCCLLVGEIEFFACFAYVVFFFVYIFPCLHGYYDVASSRLIYVFAVLGLVLSFICCNSNRNWIMDNFSCFVVLRLEQNAISSLFLNWCYHITFVLFRGGSDF